MHVCPHMMAPPRLCLLRGVYGMFVRFVYLLSYQTDNPRIMVLDERDQGARMHPCIWYVYETFYMYGMISKSHVIYWTRAHASDSEMQIWHDNTTSGDDACVMLLVF